MTTDVDWELLADHLGGALEGTPEGERVAQLVTTDPSWARAATELSSAMASVAGDLRTLPPVTMPDDIAARLDRALAAATAAPDVAVGAPTGRPAGESRRPPAHPGTRKRRRAARWGAGLALAGGVAAFAAIGLAGWEPDQTFPGFTVDSQGDDSARQAPESMDGAGEPAPTGPLVVATGSNYEAATLAITEPARPTPVIAGRDRPSPPQQAPTAELGPNQAPPVVPDPLVRLWSDPAERNECLDLVTASIQPPPVSITTVDFATYEGEPALVIWATAGDGTRWAWVSGPDCGAVTGDPDVRFETQVS